MQSTSSIVRTCKSQLEKNRFWEILRWQNGAIHAACRRPLSRCRCASRRCLCWAALRSAFSSPLQSGRCALGHSSPDLSSEIMPDGQPTQCLRSMRPLRPDASDALP